MDAAKIDCFRWVRRGARRKRVHRFLADHNNPVTASIVAKGLKIQLTRSAETLRELRQQGLLYLLNPDAPSQRYYRITRKGQELIHEVKQRI